MHCVPWLFLLHIICTKSTNWDQNLFSPHPRTYASSLPYFLYWILFAPLDVYILGKYSFDSIEPLLYGLGLRSIYLWS